MTIKAQINAAIAALQLTFVKGHAGGYSADDKVLARKRAIKGGSKGPLTVTNAHLTHCVEAQKNYMNTFKGFLQEHLGDAVYSTVTFAYRECYIGNNLMNNIIIRIPLTPKVTRVIKFNWELFSTYLPSADLDPSYQTYWYVMDIEDKKNSDF